VHVGVVYNTNQILTKLSNTNSKTEDFHHRIIQEVSIKSQDQDLEVLVVKEDEWIWLKKEILHHLSKKELETLPSHQLFNLNLVCLHRHNSHHERHRLRNKSNHHKVLLDKRQLLKIIVSCKIRYWLWKVSLSKFNKNVICGRRGQRNCLVRTLKHSDKWEKSFMILRRYLKVSWIRWSNILPNNYSQFNQELIHKSSFTQAWKSIKIELLI